MKLFQEENNKYFLILFLLVGIDLISKITVARSQINLVIIPNILSFEFMENPKTYYSMLSGNYFDIILMFIKTSILVFIIWLVMNSR